MNIGNLVLAGILIVLIVGVVFGGVLGFWTLVRWRGKRLVTCPETQKAAAVHVDAGKAGMAAVLWQRQVRLDQCSRWPERKNCGQDCLSQVNADPEHCLVWNIVGEWYKGKSCAYCQKPFEEIHWHDRHPALLSPERVAKQWNEVPPEQLPTIFETHLPVCWNCYIAETYRRQNPDRVVNRSWDRGVGGEYVPKEVDEPAPKKARPALSCRLRKNAIGLTC